jgi:hypothetical protein
MLIICLYKCSITCLWLCDCLWWWGTVPELSVMYQCYYATVCSVSADTNYIICYPRSNNSLSTLILYVSTSLQSFAFDCVTACYHWAQLPSCPWCTNVILMLLYVQWVLILIIYAIPDRITLWAHWYHMLLHVCNRLLSIVWLPVMMERSARAVRGALMLFLCYCMFSECWY